jgi:steroid delta-isomerase-like uncharacterized protein
VGPLEVSERWLYITDMNRPLQLDDRSAESKARVRRYFEEVWNEGNLEAIDELLSPDYLGHDPAVEDVRGPEGMKRQVQMVRDAFPDLQFVIDDQIAEGDMVATRWSASGTHRGMFLRIPPTHKSVTITGISFSRLRDGKYVEGWLERDTFSIVKDLAPADFLDGLLALVNPARDDQ